MVLLAQLHEHLPVGLIVTDADTLEVLYANPAALEVAGADWPRAPEVAAVVAEVAATGKPRHVPEAHGEVLARGERCWSFSLCRTDTDRWGPVVLTLVADVTDQVRARELLEERDRTQAELERAIASLLGRTLVRSLSHALDVVVVALTLDVAAVRLLDEDGKLHLVASAGFRPDEIRRLALKPLDPRRIERIMAGGPHPLAGPLGLRWVEIRWLAVGEERIGTLTVGERSARRLDRHGRALLDAAAAQLAARLETIERKSSFLRNRSLELSRASAAEQQDAGASVSGLRPRERAILRLYGEGLGTHEIAELLVLSVHTVRTHVRNALRRLGVSSRSEAVELLNGVDPDPAI